MAEKKREGLSRRTFITTGVAGSLLVPLFLDDVGALFAQTGGRPVLTIASLNELFRRIHAGGAAQALPFYLEAQANLEGFLQRHFTVNPGQLAMVRETIQLRGAGIRSFLQRGVQALQANRPVPAPTASFDAKLSPFVQIEGFGERLGTCNNKRIGARKLDAGRLRRPVNDCAGGVAGQGIHDCEFVMNCVDANALTRAC